MENTCQVSLNGQVVGTVVRKREGLYVRISCRCRMPEEKIYRLYADGEKLGVLVPENGELVLNTKVAAKRLKPDCVFSLDDSLNQFYPIDLDKEFPWLEKLRQGRLAYRGGKPGLIIRNGA